MLSLKVSFIRLSVYASVCVCLRSQEGASSDHFPSLVHFWSLCPSNKKSPLQVYSTRLSTVVVPLSKLYNPLSIFGGAPQSTYLQEGGLPDHSPPRPQDRT